jgi:hypothetical protein
LNPKEGRKKGSEICISFMYYVPVMLFVHLSFSYKRLGFITKWGYCICQDHWQLWSFWKNEGVTLLHRFTWWKKYKWQGESVQIRNISTHHKKCVNRKIVSNRKCKCKNLVHV